ncbi:MAG: poly(ethylene terephthalate) hydrolase family protein [Patiriisocius sp.]|uniref:poly(ethylene terephthalate) hydrolase family protein n=1 Tax=Patiriisocius sp. TaxID=2822396 RepID=UPI003EF4DD55
MDATIYYPTNATPPYSSIAIVPGFTALPSSVEQWGPFYASHGIVSSIFNAWPIVKRGPTFDKYQTNRFI